MRHFQKISKKYGLWIIEHKGCLSFFACDVHANVILIRNSVMKVIFRDYFDYRIFLLCQAKPLKQSRYKKVIVSLRTFKSQSCLSQFFFVSLKYLSSCNELWKTLIVENVIFSEKEWQANRFIFEKKEFIKYFKIAYFERTLSIWFIWIQFLDSRGLAWKWGLFLTIRGLNLRQSLLDG